MTGLKKAATIVGNWKMYKSIEESLDFIKELLPLIQNAITQNSPKIYLATPFTLLKPVSEEVQSTPIVIGAQNMNDAEEGAFTGEIAAKMLVDSGAKFVILGHSERRTIFHETNSFINRKVKRALKSGLQPILCVGETFDVREADKTTEILEEQLKNCLESITEEEMKTIMIAYEPVWAIGKGIPATAEVAEEAIKICRSFIEKTFGAPVAEVVSIVYGGSVKPENCKQFLEQPNIDGLLVGGASLSAETFSKIINYQEELVR